MKKQLQLGMNPSTASGRLVKDLLFKFVVLSGYACFRCKKPMGRETFSIEHIQPWLDSEDPVRLFFDLNNIAFSHLFCNSKARRITKKYHSVEDKIVAVRMQNARSQRKVYSLERRRLKRIKELFKARGHTGSGSSVG